MAAAHNPAAQCGADLLIRNAGAFSDLLAEDMSKLCVDVPRQRKEDGNLEQKAAPLVSTDHSRWQGASSNVSKNVWQADHPGGDRMVGVPPVARGFSGLFTMFFLLKNSMSCPLCLCQVPAADAPSLVDDFLNQSGGLLMSDVALQSLTCEFCQAVFPGDSTTRGEFLRHLYTHVT